MEMIMSDDEIRRVANMLAEIVMPQIKEFVKGKVEWSVGELTALNGEYYTVAEMMEQFKISERLLRKMIEAGLPTVRFNSAIRIEKSILRDALKQREGRFMPEDTGEDN